MDYHASSPAVYIIKVISSKFLTQPIAGKTILRVSLQPIHPITHSLMRLGMKMPVYITGGRHERELSSIELELRYSELLRS
jgi:hypothetical protein